MCLHWSSADSDSICGLRWMWFFFFFYFSMKQLVVLLFTSCWSQSVQSLCSGKAVFNSSPPVSEGGVACKHANYTGFLDPRSVYIHVYECHLGRWSHLSHLPTKHVACAHRDGQLCCYVWLANWFHVLRFHLVHVYSQIRFNYVFHATIGIQARSQRMTYIINDAPLMKW